MKKLLILTLSLLACTAATSFAEEGGCLVPGTNISCLNAMFGVKLGYGFYNMSGDGTDEQGVSTSNLGGLIIGGFFQYPLSDRIFIMPEFKYLRKGMDKSHSFEEYDIPSKIAAADDPSDKVKLSYLQMPVLLKYVFPVKGKVQPSVVIGPSIAYNLSAKDEASGWGAPWDGEFDITNIKKIDLSGIIGAGVTFPIGQLLFGVDLRYDKSFSSPFDDVTMEEIMDLKDDEVVWTGDELEGFDAKSGGFSIGASMILPIGAAKNNDGE